jgi:SAM-dependent methyltransferase
MDPTDKNRRAWDEIPRSRTRAASEQLLIPEQIFDLLPEIEGKHVLHLQCATGEATAQLVERSALVTAVDVSAEEIEIARERAPDVAYYHADVHELPLELHRARFDLVFTGGDVLESIRDLDQWLAGIASALKPGGTLLLYDSHPVSERVDPLGHWRENYFDSSDERAWRLEEVVNAVIAAGLRVTRLAEFQTFYRGLQRDRRVPWDFACSQRSRHERGRAAVALLPRLRARAREHVRSRRERLINEYIGQSGRGQIVSHDHFIGQPHGGFAVFEVRNEGEETKLADPGPLEGWEVTSRPLTFSLTAVGFVAQADFTLRNYGGTSLAELEEAEEPRKRFWWQKPKHRG